MTSSRLVYGDDARNMVANSGSLPSVLPDRRCCRKNSKMLNMVVSVGRSADCVAAVARESSVMSRDAVDAEDAVSADCSADFVAVAGSSWTWRDAEGADDDVFLAGVANC